MINKIKKFIDYKLLITFLIILLLGMLYLGNYNLVEGNTQQKTLNNLVSDSDYASTTETTMTNDRPVSEPENKDCSTINNNMRNQVSNVGGAGTREGAAIINTEQLQTTIRSQNNLCQS